MSPREGPSHPILPIILCGVEFKKETIEMEGRGMGTDKKGQGMLNVHIFFVPYI